MAEALPTSNNDNSEHHNWSEKQDKRLSDTVDQYSFEENTVSQLLKNKGYCYIWNECEGKLTSNEFSTIILTALGKFINQNPIGDDQELILYSDGCTYQNRNECESFIEDYEKDILKILKSSGEMIIEDITRKLCRDSAEFVTWKEENKTLSKYVRQRGCKTLKNGDIAMNYHCCQSGTYEPKGKGLKNLKSQGSAKIGISCTAVIKVRQSTENVVVQYFLKHQNHEIQLEHLRLSESDRIAIAGRLKEGVSEKKNLQDIREEITVDSGRKMLIEKKISIILKGTSILMVMLKSMKLMQCQAMGSRNEK
ncbi:MULE domain-containing protein [Trichonephila inaurata madagascariensis]|uniref:MULE domain-containing protein n=1 Tax=Trichonephila inaurata madagascariensis TaxID=2747483 RepID=A0A8X7CDS1_9ARAC|nr:MULE domain-containing protein [Trichonephila inaurata madagascariensis]